MSSPAKPKPQAESQLLQPPSSPDWDSVRPNGLDGLAPLGPDVYQFVDAGAAMRMSAPPPLTMRNAIVGASTRPQTVMAVSSAAPPAPPSDQTRSLVEGADGPGPAPPAPNPGATSINDMLGLPPDDGWDPGEGSGSYRAATETDWTYRGPGPGPAAGATNLLDWDFDGRDQQDPGTGWTLDQVRAVYGEPPAISDGLQPWLAWWSRARDLMWSSPPPAQQPTPPGTTPPPGGTQPPPGGTQPPPGGTNTPPVGPVDEGDEDGPDPEAEPPGPDDGTEPPVGRDELWYLPTVPGAFGPDSPGAVGPDGRTYTVRELDDMGLLWSSVPVTGDGNGLQRKGWVEVSRDGRIRWATGTPGGRGGKYLSFAEIQGYGLVRDHQGGWHFDDGWAHYELPVEVTNPPPRADVNTWLDTNRGADFDRMVSAYGQQFASGFTDLPSYLYATYTREVDDPTTHLKRMEWTSEQARLDYAKAREMISAWNANNPAPAVSWNLELGNPGRTAIQVGMDTAQARLRTTHQAGTPGTGIVVNDRGYTTPVEWIDEARRTRLDAWGWQMDHETREAMSYAAQTWMPTNGAIYENERPVTKYTRNGRLVAGITTKVRDGKYLAPKEEWATDVWHYADGTLASPEVVATRMASGYYDPRSGRPIINSDTGNPIGFDLASHWEWWYDGHRAGDGGNHTWYEPFAGLVSPLEFGSAGDVSMAEYLDAGHGGAIRVDAANTFGNFALDALSTFASAGGLWGTLTWAQNAWTSDEEQATSAP